LLDTSTLSAAIGNKANRNVLERLMRRGQRSAIGSVVWYELWYGCERLEPGRRKADVVGATFPILPYDTEAARWHERDKRSMFESVPMSTAQLRRWHT
jgi:predicted nucleic acid-binding protein